MGSNNLSRATRPIRGRLWKTLTGHRGAPPVPATGEKNRPPEDAVEEQSPPEWVDNQTAHRVNR